MSKVIEGSLVGGDKKFGIVVTRFNEFITVKLLGGAIDALTRHGVAEDNITVVWVPGAWEGPVALQKMAASGQYDALISLGCVIRGATPHFDYVAGEAAKGAAQVSMNSGIPILFGVLTTDTIEQAIERAGTKAGNKGFDCAVAAIEMTNVMDQL